MENKFKSTLEQLLLQKAQSALANSYSLYSGIRVGASIFCGKHYKCDGYETLPGQVITGCNVENASYGLTMCAERAAIFEAVKRGCITQDTPFIYMALVVDEAHPFMPCGACLQVMSEMAKMYNTNPKIITATSDFSEIERTTLKDLLPKAFEIR